MHVLGTRSGCAYIRHVTAKSGEAIALPAASLCTVRLMATMHAPEVDNIVHYVLYCASHGHHARTRGRQYCSLCTVRLMVTLHAPEVDNIVHYVLCVSWPPCTHQRQIILLCTARLMATLHAPEVDNIVMHCASHGHLARTRGRQYCSVRLMAAITRGRQYCSLCTVRLMATMHAPEVDNKIIVMHCASHGHLARTKGRQ